MNCDTTLSFLLPSLVSKGLVNDDHDDYALTSYPREVAMQAAAVYVGDYSRRAHSIDISKKKRVKMVVEHLGVALSMDVKDFKLMATALDIYSLWIDDLSIFGDSERQNKYIRRIIRQLSSPFGIRSPGLIKHFASSYQPLLLKILEFYSNIHNKYGSIFTEDTWKLLFRVIIGITDELLTFEFGSLLSHEQEDELQESCCNTLFSIAMKSGRKDIDLWDIFKDYGSRWSRKLVFVKVWGQIIFFITDVLSSKVLDKHTDNLLVGGIYITETQIDIRSLEFLLTQLHCCLDFSQCMINPLLYGQLQDIVHVQTSYFQKLAYDSSQFLLNRYPGIDFLKFYGKYITLASFTTDASFDDPMATMIDTICGVLSKMDFPTNHPVLSRLAAYMIRIVDQGHPLLISSFLNSVGPLFLSKKQFLPIIAHRTIHYIPIIQLESSQRFISTQFYSSIVSAFKSSLSYINDYSDKDKNVERAFSKLWTISSSCSLKYQLLCACFCFEIPLFDYIIGIITNISSQNSSQIRFVATVIQYIALLVRKRPDLHNLIIEKQIFRDIVKQLISIDPYTFDDYDLMICSTLVLAFNFVEFCHPFICIPENVNIIYDLIIFLQQQIKIETREKKKASAAFWLTKKKHYVQSLMAGITSRISLHPTSVDFYTRTIDSSIDFAESVLIKAIGIENDYSKHYFTVGKTLLLTFIQKIDGTGKMGIISRGPSGKSMWIIENDFMGTKPIPQLNQDIIISEIPKPQKISFEKLPLEETRSKEFLTSATMESFEQEDEKVLKVFENDYKSRKDWIKLGLYEEFGHVFPYQRERVIDFLLQSGLLDIENHLAIIPQTSHEVVERVISSFDHLEALTVLPIPIIPIYDKDESVEFTSSLMKRHSPSLHSLLSQIGNFFDISRCSDLPKVKCPVPSTTITGAVLVFLSPSMASTEEDAQLIHSLMNSSLFTLYFNETGFDIKSTLEKPSKFHQLIVSPHSGDLYSVIEPDSPKGTISPFSMSQTLNIESLLFGIVSSCEQMVRHIHKSAFPDLVKGRLALIQELVTKEGDPTLSSHLSSAFSQI